MHNHPTFCNYPRNCYSLHQCLQENTHILLQSQVYANLCHSFRCILSYSKVRKALWKIRMINSMTIRYNSIANTSDCVLFTKGIFEITDSVPLNYLKCLVQLFHIEFAFGEFQLRLYIFHLYFQMYLCKILYHVYYILKLCCMYYLNYSISVLLGKFSRDQSIFLNNQIVVSFSSLKTYFL